VLPGLKCISMEECVNHLRALSLEGFESVAVEEFMASTRISPDSLAIYEFWKPNFYARNLIYKDEHFELLLLCWDQGQESPVHGHEGEKCWARVERGTLRFTNYEEYGPRQGENVLLRQIGVSDGAAGALDGPAEVHKVSNPAEFGERAISLHLYSKPFDACEMYDLGKGTVKRCALKYDNVCVAPWAPVVPESMMRRQVASAAQASYHRGL
jgi:cysteine dioxygenase